MPTAETSSLARSTHKPAYKRLTDDQRIAILHLAKTGKTQMQIAETLGCDQATVSRWLSQCQDSSLEATAYLKGSALRMARNIVERGLARDHVQALKGIKVLEDDNLGKGVQITVNGFALVGMPSLSPTTEVVQGESLQIPEQAE